jgi:hypothetical protein
MVMGVSSRHSEFFFLTNLSFFSSSEKKTSSYFFKKRLFAEQGRSAAALSDRGHCYGGSRLCVAALRLRSATACIATAVLDFT